MKKENRLLETFEFDEDRTNIIPVMDPDRLQKGYKNILQEVYSPEKIYKRILTYYKTKKQFNVKYPIKRRIRLIDLYNFLRIIVDLGIIEKNRKYFWKSVIWTVKYNYNYLDLTVLYLLLMSQYQVLLDSFLANDKKGIYIYSDKLKKNLQFGT